MENRNEKDKPCQMVLHHMVHLIDYQTMRGLEHYAGNGRIQRGVDWIYGKIVENA